MYKPVWKDTFGELGEIKDGKFKCEMTPEARRLLSLHVNDNVFKNLDKFSIPTYDVAQRVHKYQFNPE